MLISPAFAQATEAAAQQGSMYGTLLQLGLIFVIFYLLLIRPQQKKIKQHEAMLFAIKKGDTVITGGGIYAKVLDADDPVDLKVEIADGIVVTVNRGTIRDVVVNDAKAAKPAVKAQSKGKKLLIPIKLKNKRQRYVQIIQIKNNPDSGRMLFRHLFAIPNVISNSDALPKWWQPVNLGLDLQGGSNLLLEVKVDDVIKERMSSIEDSARQILRENKIRYQNLNAGADSVKVKIENANSRNKAANLFRKIDDGIQATENADGEIEIKYSDVELNKLKMKIVDQSIEIVRRRIDELGTKEPVIQSQGVDRIVVQLPGLQNPEYVKTLLGKTAKMSFHLVDSRSSAAEARRGKLSASSRLIQGSEGETYVIGRKPVVSGENLVDAQPSFQEGEAVVSFKVQFAGRQKVRRSYQKQHW
ncbi:MAG: preprotein translocase subunit YajC [Alphaproteobacteria bacterium]